jgi:hypothetical protein
MAVDKMNIDEILAIISGRVEQAFGPWQALLAMFSLHV